MSLLTTTKNPRDKFIDIHFFQHDGISFTESLFPKDFVLELITGDSTHFNCQYTLNQNHILLWQKYLKYFIWIFVISEIKNVKYLNFW